MTDETKQAPHENMGVVGDLGAIGDLGSNAADAAPAVPPAAPAAPAIVPSGADLDADAAEKAAAAATAAPAVMDPVHMLVAALMGVGYEAAEAAQLADSAVAQIEARKKV